MTYRITNHEIELFLSFYRDIKKYKNLIRREQEAGRYGVDSEIYEAFKLKRVSESTKRSYLDDYCTMIDKSIQALRKSQEQDNYLTYRVIQLLYIGKHEYTKAEIEMLIGCSAGHLRRDHLNKGIDLFKSYLEKQFQKYHYTQSADPKSGYQSIIVDKDYSFEYSLNLELLFYVASNIARQSRKYFKKADKTTVKSTKDENVNQNQEELKEAS